MTAADKYFLKAKDNYPYYLDDALEALEYGLACDNEHPGLLTLMGKIYLRDLKRFEDARQQFEEAIFYDAGYTDAYYAYVELCLLLCEYKRAEQLIAKARQVQGIDNARILYLEAMLFDKQHIYNHAISNLKKAKQLCNSKDVFDFYEEELNRMESKNKMQKEQASAINIMIT